MIFPTVSVIIPAYNCESYIYLAVNSILDQTYKNIEIIIIDDGSTDSTRKICLDYQNTFNNIRYFSKENGGISSALNAGISMASGEYIVRMDADDISHPTRIEKQVNYMLKNDKIFVSSIGYTPFVIDTRLKPVIHPSNSILLKLMLTVCCPLCHPGIIAKKSVFKNFKYRDKIASEDHELWCRIASKHLIGNIEESLLFYRLHSDSLSSKNINRIRFDMLRNGLKFLWGNYSEISQLKFIDFFSARKRYQSFKWSFIFISLCISKLMNLLFPVLKNYK